MQILRKMDTNIQRYGDTYRDSAIYKGRDRDKDTQRNMERQRYGGRNIEIREETEINMHREIQRQR